MKISVIIPVYNTEKYLKQCLDSVLSQELSDYEIICINDGSTDSSYKILNEYASIYKKIKLINIKNSGVSAARNIGLKYAEGEYILFVDSDDWIEPNSLEKLYDCIKKKNVDILEFRNDSYCESVRSTGNFFEIENYENNTLNKVDLLYTLWNKLYKNEFIRKNNIYFPEGLKNAEDGVFNLLCLYAKPKFDICKELVYHYRFLRENSATANIKSIDGEIETCIYTINLPEYMNTSFENKVLTMEKYIKGILYWYNKVETSRNYVKKFSEIYKLYNFYKYITKNIEQDVLKNTYNYNILKKHLRQNIFSITNLYRNGEKIKILKFLHIKIMIFSSKINHFTTEYKYKILGLTVLKSRIKNIFQHTEVLNLFGFIPIYKHNILKRQQNRYIKLLDDLYPQYDSYFMLACNLGETFLFLAHFKEILSKYNVNNPLIIVDKKRMRDCCNIFTNLGIPNVLFEDCTSLFLNEYTEYKGKKYINLLNYDYFIKYADFEISDKKRHYYDILKDKLLLTSAPEIPTLNITSEKVKQISQCLLNNRYIIICPEAVSIQGLDLRFWESLVNELEKIGYKIFFNVGNMGFYLKNTLTVFLTIDEIAQLAINCSLIIGLRSGLLEILSMVSKKTTIAIYNRYVDTLPNKMTPNEAMRGFSLKKLPNIDPNNIFEYNCEEYCQTELLYEIITIVKNLNEEANFVN